MSLTIAIWTLIFLGALSLLAIRRKAPALGLIAAGYLLAFVDGLLDWPAVIPLVMLLGAAYAVAPE